MDAAELASLVEAEVHDLHELFEAWFRGSATNLDRVEAILDAEFSFISPRGDVVSREDLLAGLRQAGGSRSIRIRTGDIKLLWHREGVVLAAYKEWHDHADYSTARQTSALFSLDETAPGGLRWLHVHETWIDPPPTWVVPERST